MKGGAVSKNKSGLKVRRTKAYHVKAAESRSSRVVAKSSDGRWAVRPTGSDRKLAQTLMRRRAS